MSHDEFTKLFVYMQGEFSSMHKKLDDTVSKSEFRKLVSTVDGLAKRVEDNSQEISMINYSLRRHDRWFEQLAVHLNVVLH